MIDILWCRLRHCFVCGFQSIQIGHHGRIPVPPTHAQVPGRFWTEHGMSHHVQLHTMAGDLTPYVIALKVLRVIIVTSQRNTARRAKSTIRKGTGDTLHNTSSLLFYSVNVGLLNTYIQYKNLQVTSYILQKSNNKMWCKSLSVKDRFCGARFWLVPNSNVYIYGSSLRDFLLPLSKHSRPRLWLSAL